MKVGPRTNMGHQWGETSDGDRVECVWCLCSPLSTDASSQCDRFLEAQHYKQVDHIPKEGLDE
jgi:hypothetical protein